MIFLHGCLVKGGLCTRLLGLFTEMHMLSMLFPMLLFVGVLGVAGGPFGILLPRSKDFTP